MANDIGSWWGRVSEEWIIGETIYNEHIYIPEVYNYGSVAGL